VSSALIRGDDILVPDNQSALDLIATIRYETGCDAMALPQWRLQRIFFRLSTCLAGEILQKFVNYRMKLAIIGDFSVYKSKPLHDFIRECNRGQNVFFVSSKEEAIEKLSAAR
jgi:hypothetical protein